MPEKAKRVTDIGPPHYEQFLPQIMRVTVPVVAAAPAFSTIDVDEIVIVSDS